MERLDKLLANTGRWSRREARELVRQGRVTVDGAAAAAPEEKYEAGACFAVDGEIISGEKRAYVMLHKPAGLLSATEDPRRPTVMELLPEHLRRMGLFPVGRLDKDTEGLLLLTNDGPLAHRLLSPRRHVDKTYFVRADRPFEALVTIQEGKYHQIKRMVASQYKQVVYLKRLSMGALKLDPALEKGAWRYLTPAECAALRDAGD